MIKAFKKIAALGITPLRQSLLQSGLRNRAIKKGYPSAGVAHKSNFGADELKKGPSYLKSEVSYLNKSSK